MDCEFLVGIIMNNFHIFFRKNLNSVIVWRCGVASYRCGSVPYNEKKIAAPLTPAATFNLQKLLKICVKICYFFMSSYVYGEYHCKLLSVQTPYSGDLKKSYFKINVETVLCFWNTFDVNYSENNFLHIIITHCTPEFSKTFNFTVQ
jgi:hypothetical protein